MPQTASLVSRAPPLLAAALAATLIIAGCGDSTAPGPSAEPDSMGNPMPMDTASGPLTDADLLGLAAYDSTWTWWEFSDALLDRAGDSPHAEQIRTRYNVRAATQLDSLGRLLIRADFPDSSAVVKEVYDETGLARVLVMYKAEGHPNASHGAWLWAEFDPDNGSAIHSIADDSGICHNCHVTGIDHMRMLDTH